MNTILSRECRRHLGRTARCQVGEGVKFGRQLTVVDTPGWWMNYFSDESSHFDQREMVLSPSLCPPGPHVFLLTIRVDRAFTETHRRSVQEHVELISEHIWSRVILLFTFGDWLGATTTEQYIESEGTPLQWLVDRCSDRYHVLNSRTKGEGFQVRELIGKIEETMSRRCCSSWHYEIEMKVLQEVERRMKREAERVRKRLMKKEQQRHRARAQLGERVSMSLNHFRSVCSEFLTFGCKLLFNREDGASPGAQIDTCWGQKSGQKLLWKYHSQHRQFWHILPNYFLHREAGPHLWQEGVGAGHARLPPCDL